MAGTVLASLQTSLGFADTAQKHKEAGENYRTIYRAFETFQLKFAKASDEQRWAAMSEYEDLMKQLAEIPKQSPTVADKFYERAKKEGDKRRKSEPPTPAK